MASITHMIEIATPAAAAWDAVRDVGALHQRLAPGLVIDCTLVADAVPAARVVRFADGMVLHETIVACDEPSRRLVWTITDAMVDHHNGSLQVFAIDTENCRVVWTADVLPDSLVAPFGTLMAAGLEIMAATLANSARGQCVRVELCPSSVTLSPQG